MYAEPGVKLTLATRIHVTYVFACAHTHTLCMVASICLCWQTISAPQKTATQYSNAVVEVSSSNYKRTNKKKIETIPSTIWLFFYILSLFRSLSLLSGVYELRLGK